MSRAYYNEIDPFAAQWLRNLIAAGHIAPGDVDERSIEIVQPADLRGYTQCHFFAGLGAWSYALRLAGWTDDRPVWTGSCPCQPFSTAGRRAGHQDERHLWPAWFRLIGEQGPDVCFGEQVAGHDGEAWLDVVATDLEGLAYSVGAIPAPACGFGAPHERERMYFVAESTEPGRRTQPQRSAGAHGRTPPEPRRLRDAGELADPEAIGLGQRRSDHARCPEGTGAQGRPGQRPADDGGSSVAHAEGERRGEARPPVAGQSERADLSRTADGIALGDTVSEGLEGLGRDGQDGHEPGRLGAHAAGSVTAPGATNGFWGGAIWLPCSDGKARPTQPGLFPLAHGAPARVGRLRAYGNAIVAAQAAEFIRVYRSVRGL